eukprot:336721-Prymnesium_polylepis.1
MLDEITPTGTGSVPPVNVVACGGFCHLQTAAAPSTFHSPERVSTPSSNSRKANEMSAEMSDCDVS